MKNGKKYIWLSLLFFLLFAAFTAIIMTVDVQRIGPEETSVGLATFNGAYARAVGYRDGWYRLSELTGTFSLLTAAAFSLWTLVQMIRRKGVFRAEKRLLLLLAFYTVVAALYVAFDHIVINYRPVILDEGLELSYPSSHTLLAMCVMGTAAVQFSVRFADRKAIRNLAVIVCVLLLALTVVGRALSGVHWLTDIVGSILLSAAMVFLYVGLLACFENTGKERD